MDEMLKLNTDVARAKVKDLRNCADDMKELLDKVSLAMQDINDEGTGMYQGAKKPAQLKNELDEFARTFVDVYTQIVNESDKIMNITTTSENQ